MASLRISLARRLALGVFALLPASVVAGPLTLEVGSWPPLIDFRHPEKGVLSQDVTAAFAKSGVEARITEASWKMVEAHLDSGRTVSYGWILNAERQKRWRFSEPICNSVTVLVRRADTKPLSALEETRGKRVGWSRGYSYGERFDGWREQLRVEEMPTDEVGLRHLLNGTIDYMPLEATVARTLLATAFKPEEVTRLVLDTSGANVILSTPLHVVCRLGNAACDRAIASFNSGLRALRGSERTRACGD